MEKLEIKYTAEEMSRKYINKDVELINNKNKSSYKDAAG